jgi:hypothetical protein
LRKGWGTLSHDSNCPPFVACTVELTGAGIDLAEDGRALDKLFPAADPAGQKKG